MTDPRKTTTYDKVDKKARHPELPVHVNESEEMRLYRWNPMGPPPGTDPTSHLPVIEPLYFPRIRSGASYAPQKEGQRPREVSDSRRAAIKEAYNYLLTVPIHQFTAASVVYFHRKELQLCSVEDLAVVLGEDRVDWFRSALAPMEGPVAAWKLYKWPRCGKCGCYKHVPKKVATCEKHGEEKEDGEGQKAGGEKEDKGEGGGGEKEQEVGEEKGGKEALGEDEGRK